MPYRPMYRRSPRVQGITLVEVMVALIVLAVVVIGAAAFFAAGRGTIEESAQRRTAAQVGQQQLEIARAGGYEALADAEGTATVDGVEYSWTLTVTGALADPGDAESGYKQMCMVVDWPRSRGSPVTIETAMAP